MNRERKVRQKVNEGQRNGRVERALYENNERDRREGGKV